GRERGPNRRAGHHCRRQTLTHYQPSLSRQGNSMKGIEHYMPGYLLHEGAEVVVIATTESDNAKTGNMIQVWILTAAVDPITAVQTGQDVKICGDCPHAGPFGKRS